MNDNKLHDLLDEPGVPGLLQKRLLENLKEQVSEEKNESSEKKFKFGLGFSLAANVLLAVVISVLYAGGSSTAVLDMAYAHVMHEKDLEGHFVTNINGWLKSEGVNLPANTYTVGLAKNCLIGLDAAKHVRVNGHPKGVVNLIVFNQQISGSLPFGDAGEMGDLNWIKLNPKKDMQVLIFHNPAIATGSVKQIIKAMFNSQPIQNPVEKQEAIIL